MHPSPLPDAPIQSDRESWSGFPKEDGAGFCFIAPKGMFFWLSSRFHNVSNLTKWGRLLKTGAVYAVLWLFKLVSRSFNKKEGSNQWVCIMNKRAGSAKLASSHVMVSWLNRSTLPGSTLFWKEQISGGDNERLKQTQELYTSATQYPVEWLGFFWDS